MEVMATGIRCFGINHFRFLLVLTHSFLFLNGRQEDSGQRSLSVILLEDNIINESYEPL